MKMKTYAFLSGVGIGFAAASMVYMCNRSGTRLEKTDTDEYIRYVDEQKHILDNSHGKKEKDEKLPKKFRQINNPISISNEYYSMMAQ